MFRLAYKLHTLFSKKLGGQGFYPVPDWIKRYLQRYPRSTQLAVVAQIIKGADISFYVDNDLGCAETVSRLIREVLPGFPIITGTWVLDDTLKRDKRFVKVTSPEDGCVVVAPTGTGNGKLKHGHTGICRKGRVLSNNSYTGKLDAHYSYLTFTARYKGVGGFIINYYKLI